MPADIIPADGHITWEQCHRWDGTAAALCTCAHVLDRGRPGGCCCTYQGCRTSAPGRWWAAGRRTPAGRPPRTWPAAARGATPPPASTAARPPPRSAPAGTIRRVQGTFARAEISFKVCFPARASAKLMAMCICMAAQALCVVCMWRCEVQCDEVLMRHAICTVMANKGVCIHARCHCRR